ncbi:hypothetical protein [Aliivibrio fischeri]|uniref:hypothetical protein n=1 Tax=Aliivibrio fischeri TaxID=668 RepID=UPI0012DA8F3D|nr:hypothetical protein [Aliivibrio fischeri]MUJ26299.1 hypothetical protein [Aliivibrio fischeri]
MLFKEKLLLSNCDSVRQLRLEELRKRFLMGMVFGDGVVLSPNTLIDNHNMDEILRKRNLVKYLNEEGSGKLVIRGFNLENSFNLGEYYEKLPSNFILSSVEGAPEKGKLTNYQNANLMDRISRTQSALDNIIYKSEKVSLEKHALQEEIYVRINDVLALNNYFNDDGERLLFRRKTSGIFSRSDWYKLSDEHFGSVNSIESKRFKNEVINPAYNSLFAAKGEGFLLDDIKVLKDVPEKILDAGVVYKSLKNEIELVQYPYKAFEFITTLGATDLLKFITDEAMGYIEDKCQDRAEKHFSRKNWFGMYPKMQQFIGLELK